mgnify:FL=1
MRSRRTQLLAAAGVLIAVLIAVALWPRAHQRPTGIGSDPGVATCALADLPPEAADTVRLIHAGGPFPYPRNDGVVFGNREGHLPQQHKGYYHEYTVVTPGAANRATRRIITGGSPPTDPPQYFYTSDHYDSFCEISGAQEAR